LINSKIIKYRATVLWDMDGVIADTAEAHFQAWSRTLKEIHIAFSRNDFSRIFGMDNPTALSLLFGLRFTVMEGKEISTKKEKLFIESIPGNIRLFPCIRQWLKEFQNAGFPQLIASSAPINNINAVVDYLGIRTFFDQLVSAEGISGKPEPAVFLRAAQLSHTRPDHCLIIEDSHPGIIAARKANMKCIAVATTHASADLSDADLVLENCCSLTWDFLSGFLGTNN
jgi:beta-phosphoglucomutase